MALLLHPLARNTSSYPAHERLRALSPVVRSERHGPHALTRLDAVRSAVTDWEVFSSASGTCGEAAANGQQGDSTPSTDPPAHTQHRRSIAFTCRCGPWRRTPPTSSRRRGRPCRWSPRAG